LQATSGRASFLSRRGSPPRLSVSAGTRAGLRSKTVHPLDATMIDLGDVELRSRGRELRFIDHPGYRTPVRCQLARVDFRAASTGEAPVYMHAPRGVRDGTGEVFPLYCYFDRATTETLQPERALRAGSYAVEIEGTLLHWIQGMGVTMTECRLLSLTSLEQ
jgi:hypothetical protein